MRFRPGALSTLVIGVLVLAFAWLGAWQWQRAGSKQAAEAAFEGAPVLTVLPPPGQAPAYARMELHGRFDAQRHFLVDNRVLDGRFGVHVLSPFRPEGQDLTLLVNRGWLPMRADRSALPAVPGSDGPLHIAGHLDAPQMPGARLGGPGPEPGAAWPRLVTYPDLAELSQALGTGVYPRVLYLAAASNGGFQGRDWRPHAMGPDKHRAYAVQWFALALTGVVAWIVIARRRGKRSED